MKFNRILVLLNILFLLNCILCRTVNTKSTETNSDKPCPSPLIYASEQQIGQSHRCFEQCCVPCPLEKLTLEPIEYTLLVTVLPFLNMISLLGSLFLVCSYILIPSLRKFPALWIAIVAFPEAIRSFADIFIISPQFRDSLCVTPVSAAQPYSNTHGYHLACGTTAALAIAGTISQTLFVDAMILTIYVNNIWSSSIIDKKWKWVCLVIFITTCYKTVLPFIHAAIEGEGTNICFVKSSQLATYIDSLLGVLGSITFVLYSITILNVLYKFSRLQTAAVEDKPIYRKYKERTKPYQPLLIYLFLGLALYVFQLSMPQIPFFHKTKMTPDSGWTESFAKCMMTENDHSDTCRSIIEGETPIPYSLFTIKVALLLYRMSLVFVFGLRSVIFKEWDTFLKGRKRRQELPSELNFPQFTDETDPISNVALRHSVENGYHRINTHED